MTQATTKPPTFVVFVNDKELFHFSYERYLMNQIRKEFGLTGTPIRMIVREKEIKNSTKESDFMATYIIVAVIAYLIGSINFQ